MSVQIVQAANRFLVVIAFGLLISSCGRPQVPIVAPQSTQISGIQAGGLTVNLDLLIYNPNDYELSVRSLRAEVSAQGNDLGTVERPESFRLPAGQNTPFSTQVTVPWGDLPGLAITAILSPTIPYHVEGSVRVGSERHRITVSVPFQMDGQLPRTTLLNIPAF